MHPVYRNRPSRPFPRSFRLNDQMAPSAEPAVILLPNDTRAVPFTTVNAALSSPEYEVARGAAAANVEEGVGPAVSFEFLPSSSGIGDNEALTRLSSDDAETKTPKQSENKPKDLAVEFSDVHPVYVKPPSDFKPVVYPNRRFDGIRSTDKGSSFLPTFLAPPPPYPYPYPRGLSAWPLGGSRAVQRGSYWESLASDEALNLTPVYGVSSRRTLLAAPAPRRRMYKKKSAKPTVAYSSWVIYPSTFKANEPFSKSVPLPLAYQPASSRRRIVAYRAPLSPPRRKILARPAALDVTQTRSPSPSSSSSSSSSSIQTKLPVGLTSWMFGGVRDLTAKHWNMPELTVDKVEVVPASRNPSIDNKKDFFDGKELMMSGDVETFVPLSANPVFSGEVDESVNTRPQYKPNIYTNVYFDDEADNTVSVE